MTDENKPERLPQDFSPRIGGDGINCVEFLPSTQQSVFAIGTSGGRVRLWHKTVRCLEFNKYSPNHLISASAECGMKVHDFKTGQRVAYFRPAEDTTPYSCLISVADHRWVSGDDGGSVKDNKKVLVGTDEGVVLTYNWNEFGSICDRFPVRTSRTRLSSSTLAKTVEAGLPSVEKFAKLNEDIVIIGTDDGALSAFNILPNRMLSCLGWHAGNPEENSEQLGGDCMSLAVSPDAQFVASGLPSSSSLRFWSLEGIESEAARELDALRVPLKRRSASALTSTKASKSRATSRGMDRKRSDFLSGLLPPDQDSDGNGDSDKDSDDTDNDSEDS